MPVPQLLLQTLEDLRDDDFEKFKWYLSMDILEGCKPIPKSRLEKAPRIVTVSRMMESYGEESAVRVTVEILREMGNNYTADELERRHAEGKTAKPSTSSSAVAPPAAPVAPPAAPVVPPAAPVAPPAAPVAPPAAPVAPTGAPTTMSAQNGSGMIAPIITGSTITTLNITYK